MFNNIYFIVFANDRNMSQLLFMKNMCQLHFKNNNSKLRIVFQIIYCSRIQKVF